MLIAGDIGGTKTLLGLFSAEKGARAPLAEHEFHSADYPSLAPMVKDFLARTGGEAREAGARAACFDVAGPVIGGRAHLTNLPWELEEAALCRALGLEQVALINDLKAVAYAVPHLTPDDYRTLNAGMPEPGAPVAVIAPGTGLGEAFLVPGPGGPIACSSEGGHASFAPATPRQAAMWAYLRDKFGHVSWERVCSGQGIANIYDFLRHDAPDREPAAFAAKREAAHDPAPLISDAGLHDAAANPLCAEALAIFAEILADEAGNLALKVLATGGVYLAGGIPPRLLPLLESGKFMEAFRAKGRFADMMASLPVHVVTARAAFIGAARYGLDRMRG